VSTAAGAVGALILMRLTGLDRTSAFFATTSGGVVEMANQAARYGAQLEPIAVVHIMRVAFIVIVAPVMVMHLADGGVQAASAPSGVSWWVFTGLLAVASIGGLVMARLRLPNAWFLGPLVIAACIGTFGLSMAGRAPDVLLIVAQVLMGTSLGTQFRREFLRRLLPLILAGIAVVMFTTSVNAVLGIGLAYLLGLPVTTMLLALAPGGMAEMVVTAKLLGLDATLITGFQLLRIILVLLLCNPSYRLFTWMIGPPDADRKGG
jgi:membrane AbrB-like protein